METARSLRPPQFAGVMQGADVRVANEAGSSYAPSLVTVGSKDYLA